MHSLRGAVSVPGRAPCVSLLSKRSEGPAVYPALDCLAEITQPVLPPLAMLCVRKEGPGPAAHGQGAPHDGSYPAVAHVHPVGQDPVADLAAPKPDLHGRDRRGFAGSGRCGRIRASIALSTLGSLILPTGVLPARRRRISCHNSSGSNPANSVAIIHMSRARLDMKVSARNWWNSWLRTLLEPSGLRGSSVMSRPAPFQVGHRVCGKPCAYGGDEHGIALFIRDPTECTVHVQRSLHENRSVAKIGLQGLGHGRDVRRQCRGARPRALGSTPMEPGPN